MNDIDYQSPVGRIVIKEDYSVYFDDKLIGGAGIGEAAREIAIEAMEKVLCETEDKYIQLVSLDMDKIIDSPRSLPAQNEPADKLEADTKPK